MIGIGIGVQLKTDVLSVVDQIITATLAPATSVLVVGQALDETTNWATFLLTSNYATSAGGETINSVVVNYIGDTATAAEAFIDGESNHFSITVTDTALNERTFTTSARTVVYTAPIATGSLSNQSFTISTGNQTYDASGDFSGSGLTFSVNSVTGVTINPSTGVVTFDTDAMALQSGTSIIVTATNSGGLDTSGFDVSITAVAATVPDAPAPTDWDWTDALTGKAINISIISDPPDGGDTIIDYEYDVSSSGTWISGGDTIALVATIPSNGVATDLRIRAVNGVGPSLPSATKSATATDQTAPTVDSYSYDGTDTISVTVTESDVASWEWMVDDNATRTAAQVDTGGGLASGSFAISAGANSDVIDTSLVPAGNHYLHGVPKDTTGNVSDAQVQSNMYTFAGTVPDAFVIGDWTLTDPATAGDLLVTISSLPIANSDTITDVEYRLDGGSWVSSGGTVTFTISGLTDTVSYDVELRSVSAAGNALAGDLKSQTPTAADVTAPTLSSPTDAANGATASTGSVSTNEGNGTLYWVVTTSATAPSAAQVKLGQDNSSVAATDSGSQTVSGTGVQTITPAPSGLTASTAYTTHFMHEDAATNQSTVSSASGFTTGAAASGINSLGTATSHTGYNAGNPLTLAYTVQDTDSIITVFVGNQTDNSNETNYGTPTFGGVAMTQVELQANARTGCAMYWIKPSATGSTTFSIDFGIRAMSIFIEEWEGVDTTTPINASAKGTTLGLTLTTVDAAGKIIGGSTNADETVAYTVTTPSETIEREGQSGSGSLDGRSGVHSVDVASAAATEGITFAGPGNLTATIIAELNPA